MTITTLTSRDFNTDIDGAKKATAKGPVFITDRGRPAYVLLSIKEYRKLRGAKKMSLLEALAPSDKAPLADDFDFPKLDIGLKPANLD